jgi:hypothetical protein
MAEDPTTDSAGDATPEPAPESVSAAASRPAPRPSPAASAASRARRIGGTTRAPAATKTPAVPDTATDDDETAEEAATEPAAAAPADSTATRSLFKRRPKQAVAPDTAPDLAAEDSDEAAVATGDTGASAVIPDAESTDPADGDEAAAVEAGPKAEVPAWLTWAPAAILVAGAVAMAVIVSIVSHGVWWGKDTATQASVNSLRQQVTAAAKTCLAATNTYKYTDINAFEKAGTACTTGTQTTQFRKAVDTLIRKNAPKLKFSQTAQINKAAIESVSGDQWTILLYGQLAVTNTTTPNGRTDPFAAVVRMEKVHGKWLISSLRTVSSPVN